MITNKNTDLIPHTDLPKLKIIIGEDTFLPPEYYQLVLCDHEHILSQITGGDYVFISIPKWIDKGGIGIKITDNIDNASESVGWEFITLSDRQIGDFFIILDLGDEDERI